MIQFLAAIGFMVTAMLLVLVVWLWVRDLEDANWMREARDYQFNLAMSRPIPDARWRASQVIKFGREKAWSRIWDKRMAAARERLKARL